MKYVVLILSLYIVGCSTAHEPRSYSIDIAIEPIEAGSVIRTPNDLEIGEEEKLVLYAISNKGYRFIGYKPIRLHGVIKTPERLYPIENFEQPTVYTSQQFIIEILGDLKMTALFEPIEQYSTE